MRVEYVLISQNKVASIVHMKKIIPLMRIKDIIKTKIPYDNIDYALAIKYKDIANGLFKLNLIFFVSESITEPGGSKRPIKASAIIGNNSYELDLRTMEQTITALR